MTNANEYLASHPDLYERSCTALIDMLLDDEIIQGVEEDNNGYNGTYHTPLWDFCRILQGHPDLRWKSGKEVLALVEQCLANRNKTWESYDGISSIEDAHAEFLDVWEIIGFPLGEFPLETAYAKARLHPIELPDGYKNIESYRSFVGTAYYLQLAVGANRRILLPEEKLAKLLGCSPMTISRYRRWAKRLDLLIELKPSSFDRKSRKGKATEFVFSFERLAQMQREPSNS